MKKLFVAIAFISFFVSCTKDNVAESLSPSATNQSLDSRSEDKVSTPPQAVLTAFKAKFGSVTVSEWKLRSDGTWRAHFLRNGVAWEATFKADGTLVKSERA